MQIHNIVRKSRRAYFKAVSNMEFLRILAYMSFIIILLTQIQFLTLCAITIFLFIIYRMIKLTSNRIKRRGLLAYTPQWLQRILQTKSPYELLFDLWNFPQIYMFAKALVRPLATDVSAQEAVDSISGLPEGAQQFLLKKGLVYALPYWMQQALLPPGKTTMTYSILSDDEGGDKDENAEEENEKEQEDDFHSQDLDAYSTSSNAAQLNGVQKNLVSKFNETEQMMIHNQNSFKKRKNSHEKINSFNSSSKKAFLEDYKNQNITQIRFPFNDQKHLNSKIFDKKPNNESKTLIIDNNSQLVPSSYHLSQIIPTKVIASSQFPNLKKMDKGTNIEQLYILFKNILQKKSHITGQVNQVKSAFQIIQQIGEFKNAGVSKIDNRTLIKYCTFSSLFLLAQFTLSRRSRKWLMNSTLLLIYIMTFLISTGSIGIFIWKHLQDKQLKQIKQQEQEKKEITNVLK